ncbi:MAG: NYN domain-containing protein [Candidatus Kerfeldbacteria bacterium]|nr:NYN domain-containing protein [Candidatus Kerfeldbacteria bacterium]
MKQHKDQRVGVFVDVQNMYYSAKNIHQSKVNFGKILETAVGDRKLIRALAYVIKAEAPEEQSFFEALDKQGFEVKYKDLQVFVGGAKKGDWDVGLAIDAVKLASRLDVVIIVSGDGDFIPLVEYLKNMGVIVEVMAFGESSSGKLREATDYFVDLSADAKYLLRNKRILPRPSIPFTRPRQRHPEPPINHIGET